MLEEISRWIPPESTRVRKSQGKRSVESALRERKMNSRSKICCGVAEVEPAGDDVDSALLSPLESGELAPLQPPRRRRGRSSARTGAGRGGSGIRGR
jgi:hypothetical protein